MSANGGMRQHVRVLLNLTHQLEKAQALSTYQEWSRILTVSYSIEDRIKIRTILISSGALVKRFGVLSRIGALWVVENLLPLLGVGHEKKWSNFW